MHRIIRVGEFPTCFDREIPTLGIKPEDLTTSSERETTVNLCLADLNELYLDKGWRVLMMSPETGKTSSTLVLITDEDYTQGSRKYTSTEEDGT